MAQRVRVFIRYFATTDDSPTGRMALEYLKSMLRIAPVRVVSLTGLPLGDWTYYGQALHTPTPVGPRCISVVCSHPARWAFTRRVTIPATERSPAEDLEHTVDFYTPGLHNVLVVPEVPGETQAATAAKYQARIVPTEALVRELPSYLLPRTTLIAVPVTDHDRLRQVILSDA